MLGSEAVGRCIVQQKLSFFMDFGTIHPHNPSSKPSPASVARIRKVALIFGRDREGYFANWESGLCLRRDRCGMAVDLRRVGDANDEVLVLRDSLIFVQAGVFDNGPYDV